MRHPLVSLVSLVSLALLASACARQGYPTGGPKDVAPPVVQGCKPVNESRQFDSKNFYIQFDEFVVLKNASENVLVSPPLKQQPEYTTKGKGVMVKLYDTLQPNTTYLFQFKEAIADFTEGNVLPSFEYVFSTGSQMDTLMIAGQVTDARNGNAWKEPVTVMAYREATSEVDVLSDTVATHVQPDFVTRCDQKGNFAFHYIPAGRYRLVAIEDRNRNLRADPDEPVAWLPEAMTSTDSIDSARLVAYRLSRPERRQQRINSSEFFEKGRIRIVTECPMLEPAIDGIEAEWRLNSRRDTMTLWCLNPKCDSARFVLSDSDLRDTLSLRFTEKRKGRRRSAAGNEQKPPLMTSLCTGSAAYYDLLRFAFAVPVVRSADSTLAEVMSLKDSTVSRYPVVVDSGGLTAHVEASLHSGEQYRMRLGDSLFFDLYGNASDSLQFLLTPKDYGTLTLHITNRMDAPLVIEVIDSRDSVVQHHALHSPHSTLRFLHLPAGDYRLRAVIDRNGDDRWTPGDYRLQRQPEEFVMFGKTLALREKWEIEEQWIVTTVPPSLSPLKRQ